MVASPYTTSANLFQETAQGYQELPSTYDVNPNYADTFANQAGPATQVGMYGPSDITGYTLNNVNRYIDPYYEQVIKGALGQIEDSKQQNLNQVGAGASSAGAFGGSRHGLVEAQVMQDAATQATNTHAQLSSQAYAQALAAAQMDTQTQLGRDQYLAATNAQLQEAQQARSLGAYQAGAQMDVANQQYQAQLQQAALQGMRQSASDYYTIGNDQTDRMAADGQAQQDLLQAILTGGAQDYQQYLNTPYDAINLLNSVSANDPLRMASSTTQTSSSDPGLAGLAGLGLQAYSLFSGA